MGGSFCALNLVCQTGQKTLYFGPEKFLKKSVKNSKKVLTNVLRCGIIAPLRKTQCLLRLLRELKTAANMTGFAVRRNEDCQNPQGHIWPSSGLPNSRGPWKLNSVRQERKHTQYPLILTQYEKNPETRNCFQTMTLDVRMSYKLKTWLVQP